MAIFHSVLRDFPRGRPGSPQTSWLTLEMRSDGSPLVFLSRANLIKHKRGQYDIKIPEGQANWHYARHLSSDYDIQKEILLGMQDIDSITLGHMLENAHAE